MGAAQKRKQKVQAQREMKGSSTDLRRPAPRPTRHQWIDTSTGHTCARCDTKVVFDHCVWVLEKAERPCVVHA